MRHIKWIAWGAMILLAISALAGCAQPQASAAEPEMDTLKQAVQAAVKAYDLANGLTEQDYENEDFPGKMVSELPAQLDDFGETGLDAALIEEGFCLQAMINVKSDLIYVIKAVDADAAATLEQQLKDNVLAGQKQIWGQYLPGQFEKVENTVIQRQGSYVYYVTHDDAASVSAALDKALGA